MATSLHISISEYLRTTYRPDREYVDGELLERNVGKWDHARIQALLGAWFYNHEHEWNVIVATEPRVQVSPTRIRIPDVLGVERAKPASACRTVDIDHRDSFAG
jgi:Putative restriction endonuclease